MATKLLSLWQHSHPVHPPTLLPHSWYSFDATLLTHVTFCCGSQVKKNCLNWWEVFLDEAVSAWCQHSCLHLWVISCWLSDRCTYWTNPTVSSAEQDHGLVNAETHQSLISSTRIKQTLIYGLRVCVINSNEQRRESWGHFYEHILPSLPSFLI